MRPGKIILVGLPGSGKTTLGKKLASELGCLFFDLDDEIVSKEKRPITEIFKQEGEAYFRLAEQKTLMEVLSKPVSFVLATGGGTPCFFNNMEKMNALGTTVYIKTPFTSIKERLADDVSRPLMKANTLENLYEKRKVWYERAKYTVSEYQGLIRIFKS